MRTLSVLVSLLSFLPLLSPAAKAQTPGGPAPKPSDFDPNAKVPPNLPAQLALPPNSHIEVTAWTPGVNPAAPPDPTNLSLLSDPCMLSAMIETDQQNAHAVYQWQGGRSSEAYLINSLCFRLVCLAYPENVGIIGHTMDFSVGHVVQYLGAGTGSTFPSAVWYSPSTFVGTASVNGKSVLAFTASDTKPEQSKQAGAAAYPKGASVCLDSQTLLPIWLTDGLTVYEFTYTPAPNVQINPQGPYLEAIQRQFGHWP